MNTIWKFPIPVTDRFALDIPQGARFLSVQTQRGVQACMWWQLETDRPTRTRQFAVVGTGNPMPDETQNVIAFLGTFQMFGGDLVWHRFELIPWGGPAGGEPTSVHTEA